MGVVLMKIVRESPDSFMHANDTAEMVFDFCDLQSHGTAAGFQQGIRFRNFAAHQLQCFLSETFLERIHGYGTIIA
jgi:hypothetical protein